MAPSRPRRATRDVNGILLLDKPVGIRSNAALQRVKKAFVARKAGHTGNLDLLASGLLPVCFGEATKVSGFLLDAGKRYAAEFRLGQRTTTGDAEGEVLETRPIETVDRPQVERAMARFRGPIDQIPPMFSAIKQGGRPLYELAHQGLDVERASRRVVIYRFEIEYFANGRLGVDVECSKGTYIRTLAVDLGEVLGCGAHVSELRRVRVGPYDLHDAHELAAIERLAESGGAELDAILVPVDSALPGLPRVVLADEAAFYFSRGQAVLVARAPTSGLVRIYDSLQRFMGIGVILDDGRVAPRRLLRAIPPGEAPGRRQG